MNRKKERICRKCVLPEGFPGVQLDEEGVCNYCREYEKNRSQIKKLKKEYKSRFEKLASKVRGRAEYDVLLCYSGGKDSTYTMMLLKQKYKLNVLAYTMDNSFFSERAHINMRNTTENLGVDHIIFKPRFDAMKELFRTTAKKCIFPKKTLERAGAICTACTGIVKYSAMKTAVEKEIPLVGFGWSPGQAPITSSILDIPPEMFRAMQKILKDPIKEVIGEPAEAFFLRDEHFRKKNAFPKLVHPLAYEDYNEQKILKSINSIGWELPADVETNATNCLLNLYSDQAHINKYGFHPYGLEIASLVREGYMDREDGLKHLPVKKDLKIVNMVKKKLGVE
jgi:tRNA(Ile)-lysidine synthase TilS/MesJ